VLPGSGDYLGRGFELRAQSRSSGFRDLQEEGARRKKEVVISGTKAEH
jgi:hypothetical protein